MPTMELCGKNVEVKNTVCTKNGINLIPFPYVNLYIRATEACPADCPFCIYHKNKNRKEFDAKKFIPILEEIHKKVFVHKVVFTGGEPTLDMSQFFRIVSFVQDELPTTHFTVNTNGMHLKKLSSHGLIESIHCVALSRHHYLDAENAETFGGVYTCLNKDIAAFPYKNKLHLRCNLIDGYIDNDKTVYRYMDEYSKMGVFDFGFVSLMKHNEYCHKKFVPQIDIHKLPDTVVVNEAHNDTCRCRNFLHKTESGYPVMVYDRQENCPSSGTGTLVFDIDCLRAGFGGEVIV